MLPLALDCTTNMQERGMPHAAWYIFKQKKKTTGLIWNKAPTPNLKYKARCQATEWSVDNLHLRSEAGEQVQPRHLETVLQEEFKRNVSRHTLPGTSNGLKNAFCGRLSHALWTKLGCWLLACICCSGNQLHEWSNNKHCTSINNAELDLHTSVLSWQKNNLEVVEWYQLKTDY